MPLGFSRRPQTVMVELTNLCNLRCQMCGIWAENPKVTYTPDEIGAVLASRPLHGVPVVALTGGEPFLIQNFDELYRVVARSCPRSHINISTNGFYTDRMMAFLRGAERRRTSITISYDGIRSHDAIRRVDGSAARLLESARLIRKLFGEVRLSLKLTVTNENHGEILETARQCRDLGIAFRFKTLEKLNCHQGRFPSEITGPEYDDAILASIDEQARAILGLGIDTNRDYIERLLAKNQTGKAPCSCSPRTVFIGIDGQVFLCRRMEPIGNVRERPFEVIWQSHERAERAREMGACTGAPLGLGFTHA